MKYLRKWDCGVCGSAVIYDADSKEIRCNCGKTKCDLGSTVKDPGLWTPTREIKLG